MNNFDIAESSCCNLKLFRCTITTTATATVIVVAIAFARLVLSSFSLLSCEKKETVSDDQSLLQSITLYQHHLFSVAMFTSRRTHFLTTLRRHHLVRRKLDILFEFDNIYDMQQNKTK